MFHLIPLMLEKVGIIVIVAFLLSHQVAYENCEINFKYMNNAENNFQK